MARDMNELRQRGWARLAGLLYLLLLVVDVIGMQRATPTGRLLLFTGALLTVPLAIGLYYAVKPAGPGAAGVAAGCRLLEAGIGATRSLSGFAGVHAALTGSVAGMEVLRAVAWTRAMEIDALVFTVGSTIFFVLFWRGQLIPRVLAGLGLLASVVAFSACAVHLADPPFPAMTMAAWMPMLLAEVATGLWLLVRSVRVDGPAYSRAG